MVQKPAAFRMYSDEIFQAQVESGNITQEDVDKIEKNAQRIILYKNVGVYGSPILTAIYGRLYRRPPWPYMRTFWMASAASFVGMGMSAVGAISILLRTERSMENPARFRQAIKTMQEQMNEQSSEPFGSVPNRPSRSPDTSGPFGDQQGSGTLGAEQSVDGSSSTAPDEPSRWSELRQANSQARHSAWDRLREQQTKSQPSPPGPTPQPSVPASPPVSPKSSEDSQDAEKAEKLAFEAMLERERQFNQGMSEPVLREEKKSRWN